MRLRLPGTHGTSSTGGFQSGIGDPKHSRLYLDVAGANRDQLVLAGVPESHIHLCGLCTAMHLDVFTSYRAEKERAGRVAGAIRARG